MDAQTVAIMLKVAALRLSSTIRELERRYDKLGPGPERDQIESDLIDLRMDRDDLEAKAVAMASLGSAFKPPSESLLKNLKAATDRLSAANASSAATDALLEGAQSLIAIALRVAR